jgi:electron transfer flavoprotein beta subunit
MRITVCARHVVDSTEVHWDEERDEVVLRNLPTKISDYDRNAIEAAVVIKEAGDGVDLDVVMVGGESAVKTLKEAVAMGADVGHLVEGGWDDPFDPLRTARVLARVISQIGEPDIVMCGLVSEDGYSGVTGPALAQLLDLPYLAPVVGIEVDAERGSVEVVLDAGAVRRTVTAPTPCVLGIDSPMNVPRLPTVLQVMKVKNDRVHRVDLGHIGLRPDDDSLKPSAVLSGCRTGAVQRKRVVIEGTAQESALQLVQLLRKEGVL